MGSGTRQRHRQQSKGLVFDATSLISLHESGRLHRTARELGARLRLTTRTVSELEREVPQIFATVERLGLAAKPIFPVSRQARVERQLVHAAGFSFTQRSDPLLFSSFAALSYTTDHPDSLAVLGHVAAQDFAATNKFPIATPRTLQRDIETFLAALEQPQPSLQTRGIGGGLSW